MAKFPPFLTPMQIVRSSHRVPARSSVGARAVKAACLLILASLPLPAADGPVGITESLPWVEVRHRGKTVRIERNQDNTHLIDLEYAVTSRPCPPYCIQPMALAAGVETIGELEVLNYLKRMSTGQEPVLVIDSRDPEWLTKGMIPGAISIPWTRLHTQHADPAAIAEILQFQFGAIRQGPLWNFSYAKTLVFYCNGMWCGQSPTNIRALLALGYPAHKLKWYRDGMQGWLLLGLTSVQP
jgi:rhodanese-related sulfurtransferase